MNVPEYLVTKVSEMSHAERIEKTTSGVKWSFLGQFISQGANIFFAVLLTRLLSPDVFGLIAMVLVFSGILTIVKDFGISSALIYKKKIGTEDLDTAFWAQVFMGVVLTLLFLLSRNFIASFYNESDLGVVILCISFVFAFDSLGYVHAALLRKRMLFKQIVIVETISVVISGLISLILAINSCGVWSLIAKIISLSITQTILLWLVVDWRPSIKFFRHIFYEQLRYGVPLVGNQLSVYLMRNADNLLIGKFIGADALGIYNRAYSLMMLPIKQLVGIYCAVLFPSFCLISEDNDALRSNWIKITRFSTFLILPIASLMFLLSEDFVSIVLGNKWGGVIPVLKYLSLAVAVQTICEVNYIFNAKGKNNRLFIMNTCINLMLLVAVILGLPYGIKSVALFYAIASVLFIPLPVWFFTTRLVGGTVRDVLSQLSKIFLINGCTFFIFVALKNYVVLEPIFNLLLLPISYSLAYLSFLFLVNERIFNELYVIVKRK